MGLLETLVLGSYAFTAACWGWVYRQLNNHMNTRLKKLERKVFGEEQE